MRKHSFPEMRKLLLGRCLILISCFCLIGIPAIGQNQQIHLQKKALTLKEAFGEIERQTDLSVDYDAQTVNVSRQASVPQTSMTVNEFLKAILQGTGYTHEIQGNHILIKSSNRQGTPKLVSGKIVDSKGEPVAGANILVVGSNHGTSSNQNGEFSIDVSDNDILDVSFIGFVPEQIQIKGQSLVNIRLKEDTKLLDEVVVIGYGTVKRSDLTGSTSSLSGDKITTINTPQFSAQLQGKMAGVQVTRSSGSPNSTATIRVRGVTTISTNDPLVIVDGVPGDINDIASEDVENIQVLKDAASAAIYGSRAAAGVILITTKRANSKDFHLGYNIEYGIDTPTEVPSSTNAVNWMKGLNEYMYNGGASSLSSVYSDDYINSYSTNHASDPDNYPDTDWMNLGLKNTTSHQRHTFTLSGGTEKLRTNFSLNYYNTDALYKSKNYEKYNVRINNDYNINKYIHAAVDLNLSYGRYKTPQTGEGYTGLLLYAPPVFNAYWSDGSFAPGKDGENPLAILSNGGSILQNSYHIRGKIQLDITPFKNLTVSAVVAPNWYFYKGKNHRISYKLRQLNGDYIYGNGSSSTNLSESRNDNNSITKQLYANYKIEIGKHSISVMAGYEDYAYKWENESAWRQNYTLKNFPYLDLGPADYQYNSGSASHNAYRSVFGRVMYSFDNRYLIQANIRSDGSSRFAKGHRWGTFPSFSAGWVISEEPWFKSNSINFLKLRASIGQLGNERIGSDFPYQAALNFGTGYIPNISTGISDIVQTAYQSDYAFEDITWETTTTYGIGTDFSLLRGRLRGALDIYYKKTKDMLLEVGFPSYFGYNSPTKNAADMHTRGWDLELSWNDQIGDFGYSISANLSDYRSKMGYMADRQVIGSNKITEEGSYYNEWYMYKSKGIILNEDAMYDSDGNKIPLLTSNDKPGCIQYVDIDKDGNITASKDRVKLGNSLPEYLYGGSISANWKGIDFNLSFQGIGHRKVLWSWYNTPFNYTAYSCPQVLWNSHWSPNATDEQNAKAKYPMISSNQTNLYAASDFYLFNGAYMRIKNITLGYTLPKNITQKIMIDKLRFYFTINDLPAFSNYPHGYDPEWSYSSDLLLTSYIFGMNINF